MLVLLQSIHPWSSFIHTGMKTEQLKRTLHHSGASARRLPISIKSFSFAPLISSRTLYNYIQQTVVTHPFGLYQIYTRSALGRRVNAWIILLTRNRAARSLFRGLLSSYI